MLNALPWEVEKINKEKLKANGLSEEDLGVYVDILMDGRKIDEYRPLSILYTKMYYVLKIFL